MMGKITIQKYLDPGSPIVKFTSMQLKYQTH